MADDLACFNHPSPHRNRCIFQGAGMGMDMAMDRWSILNDVMKHADMGINSRNR